MAQILEAEGTLTTVTLLEGDPEILAECAKHFLSDGYITKKLTSVYGSLSSEVNIKIKLFLIILHFLSKIFFK